MLAGYDAKNPVALARLLDTEDVTMRPFSKEVMDKAREITREILSSEAASDPTYRRILENYQAFQQASNRWLRASEHTYADFTLSGG